MDDTHEDEITTEKWVDETDVTVEMDLDIDHENETLDGEQLFDDDADPDDEGTIHH